MTCPRFFMDRKEAYKRVLMATSADIPADLSSFDRLVQAWQARFTGGLSPASLWLSYFDWLAHVSNTPGNQARLIEQSWRDGMRLAEYTPRSADPQTPACVEPRPQDRASPVRTGCAGRST